MRPGDDTPFVWCRMTNQKCEDLSNILRRKEAERLANDGEFWWTERTSLGDNLDALVSNRFPSLVFCANPNLPRVEEGGLLWTHYQEWGDDRDEFTLIPDPVLSIGPKVSNRDPAQSYSLICRSKGTLPSWPLPAQKFDTREFETHPGGKCLAGSAPLVLVKRRPSELWPDGEVYKEGFKAILLRQVKLARHRPQPLSQKEIDMLNGWDSSQTPWIDLVKTLKQGIHAGRGAAPDHGEAQRLGEHVPLVQNCRHC
jgi:hypothetical protein